MDRSWIQILAVALLLVAGVPATGWAHQPVMDMAPRWEDGWGFQVRNEYRFSDELQSGASDVSNPQGRERTVNTTWLEGVYTFKRGLRLTGKIPWVQQDRVSVVNGAPVKQNGSGIGDSILGLQLKYYYNREGSTGNFGLTPSIRIPTGSTSDDFPVGDGSWDVGVSASFSAEMASLYQFYDVFYWHNTEGNRGIDRGDEVGLDVNIGVHPYHNNLHNAGIFVMGDLSARYEGRGNDTTGTTGGKRISLGPVLVGYWNNIMLRTEVKFPVYESVWGTQVGHGIDFNVGLGVTF